MTPILLLSVACGGETTSVDESTDGGSKSDAQPQPSDVDGGYLACMDDQGQIDPALKACAADDDCVTETQGVNCCGSSRYVGIAKTEVPAFTACVASWNAHVKYGMCTCASRGPTTEDGKAVGNPASVLVHCANVGGTAACTTYQND
ncbi:MAG: hypothetical protein ACRELY_09825 [Polyangiaceae bacterium]